MLGAECLELEWWEWECRGGEGPRPKGRRARVHNDFKNGGGRGPLSPSWPSPYTANIQHIPPWSAGIRRYPRGDGKYPGTYTLNPWIIREFKMNTCQYHVSSLGGSDAHLTTLFHIRFFVQNNRFICKEPLVLPEHWSNYVIHRSSIFHVGRFYYDFGVFVGIYPIFQLL